MQGKACWGPPRRQGPHEEVGVEQEQRDQGMTLGSGGRWEGRSQRRDPRSLQVPSSLRNSLSRGKAGEAVRLHWYPAHSGLWERKYIQATPDFAVPASWLGPRTCAEIFSGRQEAKLNSNGVDN